jgi:aminoglycoside phosphotransferase (APT) family kinase protein
MEGTQRLKGGTQNLLLRFERGGRGYVLRRPPHHPRPEAAMGLAREARVLSALSVTAVPHPRLIATCADSEVIGAPFYLMEEVAGFNPCMGLPERHAHDPALRRQIGLSMAGGAASLAGVDAPAIGLADLGRPEGFLERQVRRWRGLLASYEKHEGWTGPSELPGILKTSEWLEQHRPPGFVPGLMHGDYHLSNVLIEPDTSRIAAIVDWEMVTYGDPLLDLGWLLATWPDERGISPVGLEVTPWSGFPSPAELIASYAAASGRDVRHIRWYAVLACYKLGIVQEGTHARACAGLAPRETGDRLHAATVRLLQRALAWSSPTFTGDDAWPVY